VWTVRLGVAMGGHGGWGHCGPPHPTLPWCCLMAPITRRSPGQQATREAYQYLGWEVESGRKGPAGLQGSLAVALL
jgi:hypothetical protein